jgi:hypothetical protein
MAATTDRALIAISSQPNHTVSINNGAFGKITVRYGDFIGIPNLRGILKSALTASILRPNLGA